MAFGGSPKPPKPAPAPASDQAVVQQAAADARKRAVLAKGRSTTDVTATKLGLVGV